MSWRRSDQATAARAVEAGVGMGVWGVWKGVTSERTRGQDAWVMAGFGVHVWDWEATGGFGAENSFLICQTEQLQL